MKKKKSLRSILICTTKQVIKIKKNVVFLIGQYKPFMSPSGNIADGIINELKDKYNITIITRRNNFKLNKVDQIDGIKILRINDFNLLFHDYLTESIKSNDSKITKSIYKNLLQIKRMIFYIPRFLRAQSISKYYIKRILKMLNQIYDEHEIDVIIPVSAPHEEVFASVEFKKNKAINCKLLIYQLDRFANGNSLYCSKIFKKIKFQNNIELERNMLSTCNKLFVLPPIKKYYDNIMFKEFKYKIIKTEHPLVKEIQNINYSNFNDGINITYAGSLDKNLRNPKYLFELFSSGKIVNEKIKLNLYTFGNCQDIIDEYKNKNPKLVYDYGKVSSEKVQEVLAKSNILLTIGNNSDEEVPSKLFEYLSYCKPIVHLYYSDKDEYLSYLKNHPMAICLKMDFNILNANREKLKKFIDNINYKIDISTILDLYNECTPEHVSKKFIEEIERKDENEIK